MSSALVGAMPARACISRAPRHHACAKSRNMDAHTQADCICALRLAATELLALAESAAGQTPAEEEARQIQLIRKFLHDTDRRLPTR